MSTTDSILEEPQAFLPHPSVAAYAAISGMDAYRALVAEAERDYEGFWARLARETLSWNKPFSTVLDESNAPFYTWFEDGELNASYNCLDRHVEAGNGEHDRDHLRSRRRHRHQRHVSGPAATRVPLRQRAEKARREEGRPRGDLHADVDRRHRRDAGLRAHRRDAFGRVRRLLVEVAQ